MVARSTFSAAAATAWWLFSLRIQKLRTGRLTINNYIIVFVAKRNQSRVSIAAYIIFYTRGLNKTRLINEQH